MMVALEDSLADGQISRFVSRFYFRAQDPVNTAQNQIREVGSGSVIFLNNIGADLGLVQAYVHNALAVSHSHS